MLVKPEFFAGVDGGGTKCSAQVFDQDGNIIGTGVAGPANVARSEDVARQSIIDAVIAAFREGGLDGDKYSAATAVGAGLAGANLPSASRSLKRWEHPFASFTFTSDLHAATLGAHNGNNGAVLVVGTGSCSAALLDGKLYQFGGHGFMLGDKGSGAWMGRSAVVHTLEALDGVCPAGAMAEAVCRHYDCQSATDIVDRLNNAPPAWFGQLAPVLFTLAENQDEQALRIIREGAEYLDVIAGMAIQKSAGRLAMVGGVADAIVPFLSSAVQSAITPASNGPEWGAVNYLKSTRQDNI